MSAEWEAPAETPGVVHGPLTAWEAGEVERRAGRVPGLLARNCSLWPTEAACFRYLADMAVEQTVYSVLFAPEQATQWAWVAQGLEREIAWSGVSAVTR